MKKFILILLASISLSSFAVPNYLFRPTGKDILKNCSEFFSEDKQIEKKFSDNLRSAVMLLLCQAAVNNTYETIRGPMIEVQGAKVVCYQNYYYLDKKSDISVLKMTVKYIKKHRLIRDENLSIIMSVMMNEYYPIPAKCKK